MKQNKSDWPVGIKKTKPRELVLNVLKKSDTPLCALDIYSIIDEAGDQIWLSTVYRALETFVNNGIVVKTTIMDNEMAVYEMKRDDHKHYAVCIGCHKIVYIDNCPMEQFVPKMSDNGFQFLGHKVEMYGYCKDCILKMKNRGVK